MLACEVVGREGVVAGLLQRVHLPHVLPVDPVLLLVEVDLDVELGHQHSLRL